MDSDRSRSAVPYRRMTDEALVACLARADAPALAELYDRHHAAALRLATRVLHDGALAEDAVQEAFLSAWRTAGAFAPERGRPKAWLLMLTHRRAVDIVRRRPPAELLAEPADGGAAEPGIDALADREHMRAALRRLPWRLRAPLALAYYLDLSQPECAQRLREPLGTVKSRTSRGLVRLRHELAEPRAS